MRIWAVVCIVGQLGLLVQASHHHHGHTHDKFHDIHKRESASPVSKPASEATSKGSYATGGISDAADAVARALSVLQHRNQLRLENVQYNNYTLATPSESRSDPDSAPLDYSESAVENSMKSGNQPARRSTDTKDNYGYSIPSELRKAARILAESEPPSPSRGNHSAVAALMREKYGTEVKDTSIPPQTYRTYNGLSDIVMGNNSLSFVQDSRSDEELGKRASTEWWMATMTQRGANPYAPSGYQV